MPLLKILTVIGARPQIIKAAAISRAIRTKYASSINEILVHTGQHYDENMSKVFFQELNIPEPHYNLGIGSSNHSNQTALMLQGISDLIEKENPNLVLLYGDTNSTLSAALAGSKIHVPIVHIEGGLRSFSKVYPEEINRIITDHVSTVIFTPTVAGFNNLVREGFRTDTKPPYTIDNPGIFHCGDIMYDNTLYYSEVASVKSKILKELNIADEDFVLVTIHRDINTDNPKRLTTLFNTIIKLSEMYKIKFIIPLHPRTTSKLKSKGNEDLYKALQDSENINIIPPASFLDITALEKNAKLVITDSGGVQKEAFFFKKPCIILLKETPWIELVECGAAILGDADELKIMEAFAHLSSERYNNSHPNFYGDGKASEFICEKMISNFSSRE